MVIQIQTSVIEPAITERQLGKTCYICGYSLFTEKHHIIPLAKGGVDEVKNKIVLCPNCHRAAHHGYINPDELFIFKRECEENGRQTENLIHVRTKSEAGKLGALMTKRKYGIERCPTCGAVRTSGFYAQNGAKGGQATVLLHGRDHMVKIGKLGGRGKHNESNL